MKKQNSPLTNKVYCDRLILTDRSIIIDQACKGDFFMKISDGELKLMELIWDNAPIRSGELVTMAFDSLGWKKSTVYTVVKKLSGRGIIKSENAVITPLCTRDEVMSEKSENLITKGYGGSLPMFLTAFLQKEKLTKSEAEELKKLIDDYTEGD